MNLDFSKPRRIRGMDQRLSPEPNTAHTITMFRVDDEGGFINDVGWEPLIPSTSSTETTTDAQQTELYSPVRFLSVWSRHQNSETYYLYERNGNLQYDWGNKGLAADNNVILASDRYTPKSDDPGTQIAPFGRFALLLNGYNEPLKFFGRELIQTFGWTSKPATPNVLNPQPTAFDTTGTSEYLKPQYAAIWFDHNDYWGVGNGANGAVNSYGYRVAFLSNTGSMSPLSEPFFIAWNIQKKEQEAKHGVVLLDIPIGPAGTVGRIIFRTKNKKDGISDVIDEYYEVFRIYDNITKTHIDIIPDSELNGTPVDLADSVPIDHGYKYATEWDSCMWLAGGEAHPNKIIYSKQNLPEQFPALNYFDVGTRDGGHITAVVPYYNSLLVFRQKAIDIINKTSSGYSISTLDPFIGTTATNTIKFVPEVGVVFLAKDGVYAISGGLYGGSEHRAKHISGQLSGEWKRLSTGSLARATATYSSREQEYWVHYPADGQTENIRGAVYHLQTQGWSLRNTGAWIRGEMKFTQLATDPNGWIIIGTYLKKTTPAIQSSWPGVGLQVWSRAHKWGDKRTFSSTNGQGVTTWSISNETVGYSTFLSVWEDFGALDTKKSVMKVVVEGLSQGANTVDLYWYADYGYTGTLAGSLATLQSEYYATSSSQSLLAVASVTPSAIWGTTAWESSRRVPIVWHCGTNQISSFRFEIKTQSYVHILSYSLGFESTGMKSNYQKG